MTRTTETPFLTFWRTASSLPIEDAYAAFKAGAMSYADYRRGYADPEDARRAEMRRAGGRIGGGA